MTDVRSERQLDRVRVELACGCRTTDPAGRLATRVLGNGLPLRDGASRERFAQSPGKLAHVALIDLLSTLRSSLARSLSDCRIGQALTLRLLESRLLDQHSLTLVAFSRATEPNDHRPQGRVLRGASGQRRITTGKEDQVIEVGACEAQGPLPFDPEKAALPELTAAFHTGRIPNDPEHDDIAGISTGVATALC